MGSLNRDLKFNSLACAAAYGSNHLLGCLSEPELNYSMHLMRQMPELP